MPRSAAVDGVQLAYDRHGDGPAVVLLHGWPGDRHDWREVIPRLADAADVVVPDLRGFGESDKPARPPATFGAAGQAASVRGLIEELGLERPVLAGYDVGSRTAQQLAREVPEAVGALVLAPPLPGAGERVLTPEAQAEFWYQAFHRLPLAEQLIDGDLDAVGAYLTHFWNHWSGPAYTPDPEQLRRLGDVYAAPGAFTASLGWYRAGSGTIAMSLAEQPPDTPDARIQHPTTVLWPEHDPLFPPAWSDRLDEFFADVSLQGLDGAGHFSPLEAPDQFAAAIRDALATLSA